MRRMVSDQGRYPQTGRTSARSVDSGHTNRYTGMGRPGGSGPAGQQRHGGPPGPPTAGLPGGPTIGDGMTATSAVQHKITIKDGVVISFVLALWLYSIILMFRYNM